MTIYQIRVFARGGLHVRRAVWGNARWWSYIRGVWWYQEALIKRTLRTTDYTVDDLMANDWTTIPHALRACPIDPGHPDGPILYPDPPIIEVPPVIFPPGGGPPLFPPGRGKPPPVIIIGGGGGGGGPSDGNNNDTITLQIRGCLPTANPDYEETGLIDFSGSYKVKKKTDTEYEGEPFPRGHVKYPAGGAGGDGMTYTVDNDLLFQVTIDTFIEFGTGVRKYDNIELANITDATHPYQHYLGGVFTLMIGAVSRGQRFNNDAGVGSGGTGAIY